MSLDTALAGVAALARPESVQRFREDLDPLWVEEALSATGTATLRRRRLPAEQVVWLVLGMALFRDRSIIEVVSKLDLALPGPRGPTAAPSAVAQARARLGAEPLGWLFERCAAAWAVPDADAHRWRGLALYGVDGTTLRVPDSPANRAHFGGHAGGPVSGESAYPLVRLVALMALRSHLLAAAEFGPCAADERRYAEALWARVPDESLTIVDRHFLAAGPLLRLGASGRCRHWLVRAKKTTRYRVLRPLGPGEALVELAVSARARRRDRSLPRTWQARAIAYQQPGRAGGPQVLPQVLLTSLLDGAAYPAAELIALYHERWEMELAYDEVKTVLLAREEAIRSRSPAAVAQELWGMLLAYNLVRLEMARVAAEAGVAPPRVSFVGALRLIRDEWLWCAVASPGAIPRHLRNLRRALALLILPERRRERRYPRAVKLKMSPYPRNRASPARA
jgi:hypothetical protein